MEKNIFKLQGRFLKGVINKNKPTLKVMSYNILANINIFKKESYNNKIIDFIDRIDIIKNEINTLKPDIICLQELEEHENENFSNMFMSDYNIGFHCKMNKKEGLAIMYNKNKYKEIDDGFINFDISNLLNLNNYKSHYISNLLNYSNILSYKVLHDIQNNKNILILNNHLPFNKNRGFVKLYQVYINLLLVEKIKKKYYLDINLICGDFNLVPNSAIYDYITKNYFDTNTHQWEYSNQSIWMKLLDNNSLKTIKKLAKIGSKRFNRFLKNQYKFMFNYDNKDFFEFIKHLYINDNMEINFDLNIENDFLEISKNLKFENSYEVLLKKLKNYNEFCELISHSNGEVKFYCDFILYIN